MIPGFCLYKLMLLSTLTTTATKLAYTLQESQIQYLTCYVKHHIRTAIVMTFDNIFTSPHWSLFILCHVLCWNSNDVSRFWRTPIFVSSGWTLNGTSGIVIPNGNNCITISSKDNSSDVVSGWNVHNTCPVKGISKNCKIWWSC